MNLKRLVLAAIAACVTLFAGEVVFIAAMGSRIMASRQAARLPEFVPQPLWSIVELLLTGTFIAWLYAAIRTRYGAGPVTAVRAGIAAWTAVVVQSTIHMVNENLGFPVPLLLVIAVVVLPVFVASAIVGAWVYRE